MDFIDLKNKSIAELKELVAHERGALHDAKAKVASQQLKQVHKIKQLRQTIARIMTLLSVKK